MSLSTTEAWWLDCLERGYVFRSRLGLEADFSTWHSTISMELLFASYTEFAKAKSERRVLSRELLGKFFAGLGAAPKRWRNGVVGEHILEEQNMYGGVTRKAKLVTTDRTTGYVVSALSRARADFLQHTGLSIIWDLGAEDEDGVPGRPLDTCRENAGVFLMITMQSRVSRVARVFPQTLVCERHPSSFWSLTLFSLPWTPWTPWTEQRNQWFRGQSLSRVSRGAGFTLDRQGRLLRRPIDLSLQRGRAPHGQPADTYPWPDATGLDGANRAVSPLPSRRPAPAHHGRQARRVPVVG